MIWLLGSVMFSAPFSLVTKILKTIDTQFSFMNWMKWK